MAFSGLSYFGAVCFPLVLMVVEVMTMVVLMSCSDTGVVKVVKYHILVAVIWCCCDCGSHLSIVAETEMVGIHDEVDIMLLNHKLMIYLSFGRGCCA